MIYVVSCEDSLLLKMNIDKQIREKISEINEFNYASFDMYNQLIQDAIDFAETASFFDDFKAVICFNCYFLSSQTKANANWASKMDFDTLLNYLDNQNPDCDLYLTTTGTLNAESSNKLIKALKSNAKFITISKKTDEELVNECRAYVTKNNCNISTEAAIEVIKRTNSDYMLMINSLDKLMLFTSSIRLDDVDKLITPKLEDSAFSIVNDLFKFDIKSSIKSFRDLISVGNSPIVLFSTITSQFVKMYEVSKMLEMGIPDQEIAKALKYKSIYYVKKGLGNFTSNDILLMMKDLHDIEINIKYDLDNPINALEIFILNFRIKYFKKK